VKLLQVKPEQGAKRQKLKTVSFEESLVKEKKNRTPKKSLKVEPISLEGESPVPVPSPPKTPKKPPPSVDELVALWQGNIDSDMSDTVFSSQWRRLPSETRHQVLPRLIINFFEVILYCPIRNKEQFYLDAMLVQAEPAATWLQLVFNARSPATDTKEFLDGVFEVLKDDAALEPHDRLSKYLAHFSTFPSLRLLHSWLSLCPSDHFTGYWRVPASRWLLTYIDEVRSVADYEKSVFLIDGKPPPKAVASADAPPPTLAEQVINHIHLADPEFLVKVSRLRQADKGITNQAELNAALIKALLPPFLAEQVLGACEPLPVCDCENLCQLCFGDTAERLISGLDKDWMPEGRARVCKACQMFNVLGKQQTLTKEFVCQALLQRVVE